VITAPSHAGWSLSRRSRAERRRCSIPNDPFIDLARAIGHERALARIRRAPALIRSRIVAPSSRGCPNNIQDRCAGGPPLCQTD